MSNRLLVLGWHNVDPTPAFPGEREAARKGFEWQIRTLSRVAHVVRLPEIARRIAAGEPLPARAVALTFDDGYADALSVATPILQRHGVSATFFLVSGYLDQRLGAWWEEFASAVDGAPPVPLEWRGERYDLAQPAERERAKDELPVRLKELTAAGREEAVGEIAERLGGQAGARRDLFLDWTGAAGLLERGQDVGSHSDSHPILSRETADVQGSELESSRSALRSRLGVPVETLAYPNGRPQDFDGTTVRCAREAGYLAAVTVQPGLADRRSSPYAMDRVLLTPYTDVRSIVGRAFHKVRSRVGSARS